MQDTKQSKGQRKGKGLPHRVNAIRETCNLLHGPYTQGGVVLRPGKRGAHLRFATAYTPPYASIQQRRVTLKPGSKLMLNPAVKTILTLLERKDKVTAVWQVRGTDIKREQIWGTWLGWH